MLKTGLLRVIAADWCEALDCRTLPGWLRLAELEFLDLLRDARGTREEDEPCGQALLLGFWGEETEDLTLISLPAVARGESPLVLVATDDGEEEYETDPEELRVLSPEEHREAILQTLQDTDAGALHYMGFGWAPSEDHPQRREILFSAVFHVLMAEWSGVGWRVEVKRDENGKIVGFGARDISILLMEGSFPSA